MESFKINLDSLIAMRGILLGVAVEVNRTVLCNWPISQIR